MLEAIGVIVGVAAIIYFLRIFGDIRYDKGKKDEHEDILKTLITPERYDALKTNCYPSPEIRLDGQLVVGIKVVECMHKATEIKFIENKN
jgi:hypothetical protein